MTDTNTTPAGEGPLLWSDDNTIINRWHEVFGEYPDVGQLAFVRTMRDALAAERDALAAKVAELTQHFSDAAFREGSQDLLVEDLERDIERLRAEADPEALQICHWKGYYDARDKWQQRQLPSEFVDTIREALRDKEYAAEAFFDGDPVALEDAAKCRATLKWLDSRTAPARDIAQGGE